MKTWKLWSEAKNGRAIYHRYDRRGRTISGEDVMNEGGWRYGEEDGRAKNERRKKDENQWKISKWRRRKWKWKYQENGRLGRRNMKSNRKRKTGMKPNEDMKEDKTEVTEEIYEDRREENMKVNIMLWKMNMEWAVV